MRFAREIRRAASEMPAGVRDLFHLTSNEVRYFTIFDRKLFHVLHSKTFHFPIFPSVPTVPFATASKKQQPNRQSVKNASKKFQGEYRIFVSVLALFFCLRLLKQHFVTAVKIKLVSAVMHLSFNE